MDSLIEPHGAELVDLLVPDDRARELKERSQKWPSWDMTPRQICDLELLLNGAFSPLRGFMNQRDYESVCTDMRLESGLLWPIPIVLDVGEEFAESLSRGDRVALRDPEGVMLAVLTVEDVWKPDKEAEARHVYGTADPEHKGVEYLLRRTNDRYVGGTVEGIQMPFHFDSKPLRLGPREIRAEFSRFGWRRVIAFQTSTPMHRAHYEITMRAIREHEANLLLHPVVGMTKPGDIDHYTRVRCYQALLLHYPQHTVYLALVPLSMRLAGPQEAVWNAIIRKNYGCTHFMVQRADARQLLKQYEEELGITAVSYARHVYVEDRDAYMPEADVPDGMRTLSISEIDLRERLAKGRDIPVWFTFPEIARELRRTYPPRYRQGFTVFFTGLSGAGKSTIAKAFQTKLLETGGRPVTLLDGDIVRKNLSSELGFSKAHRNLNIQRIGFVANEITKNGGIAICAPIAPYDAVRKQVRQLIEQHGGFILVYVSTPLEVCEQRDRKGLYAKARRGIINEFTGISDPYEAPEDADVVIDTSEYLPEEAAQKVILHLEREGYIGGEV